MRAQTVVSLGYVPRAWQRECHTLKRRFNVLALHRRAGKTELAFMDLIDCALRNTLDLPFYVYIAPFLKQAKAIMWARLKARLDVLVRSGAVSINETELSVQFRANGAVIRLFGADNPDAMRGLRLDGAILDEVAQMKPEIWDDIVQPALADRLGWATFIGTPNGANLFSTLYFQGLHLPDWFCKIYTVYDTDALDPGEVARLRSAMSDTSFAREYLCDFAAAGEEQLLSLTDLDLASRRVLRDDMWSFAPRVLGVDPARFGSDRSVIYRRQGLNGTFKPDIFVGMDNMRLADAVARRIDTWQPDAVFIDEGQGGGVIDRLKRLGHSVHGVHFGGRASSTRFVNKRAEMWWDVREWVHSGGALWDSPALRADLAAPTYWHQKGTDRIELEAKADIKARLKASPDMADALALTFAAPVHADNSPVARVVAEAQRMQHGSGPEAARQRVLDYNPY